MNPSVNMSTKKHSLHESDFPAELSQPALRALYGAGYTRLKELTKVTEADVLQLHGMGPKSIRTLKAALKKKGWSFKSEASPKKQRGTL